MPEIAPPPPAPSAKTAPTPPPPPAPEPVGDLQPIAPSPDFGDDPELDAIHADPPKPEPKAEDSKSKPGDRAQQPKADDKGETEDDSVPQFDKKSLEALLEHPKAPKWWRGVMKKALAGHDLTTSELASVKVELQKIQATPKITTENTALASTLAEKEKRLAELEQELKLTRYEKSPEFKEKFEIPYMASQKRALATVAQLRVKQTDAEGNESFRQGTVDDFNKILNLPEGAAWEKAYELFGNSAQVVFAHYQKLSEIAQASTDAIEEHRTKGALREQETTAKRSQEQEATASMWKKANEGYAAKYPAWFAPVEGDTEGNAALEKGYQTVDVAFNGRESLSPQQRVILDAKIRNYAAAFPRMAMQNKSLKTRVEALEKELDEFKESGPGPGKRATGDKAQVTDGDYVEANEALEKLG